MDMVFDFTTNLVSKLLKPLVSPFSFETADYDEAGTFFRVIDLCGYKKNPLEYFIRGFAPATTNSQPETAQLSTILLSATSSASRNEQSTQ